MVVISLHSVFRWYFCCALRIIYHTFYWKNLVESSFPILKQTKNWKDSLLFQSSSFVPISVSRSITCKLTRTLEPRSSTFQVRLQILNIQQRPKFVFPNVVIRMRFALFQWSEQIASNGLLHPSLVDSSNLPRHRCKVHFWSSQIICTKRNRERNTRASQYQSISTYKHEINTIE